MEFTKQNPIRTSGTLGNKHSQLPRNRHKFSVEFLQASKGAVGAGPERNGELGVMRLERFCRFSEEVARGPFCRVRTASMRT